MTDVLKLQCLSNQGQVALSSATNHIVDASNEGVAWVAMAETSNPIIAVGFRYGARTGTPPTYRVSLQAVNTTTGNPSGTVLGGGSPASVTFTPPADATWDGTWRKLTLDNSYTPANREEIVCVVIEYSSGTIDVSNNSSFTRGLSNHQNTPTGLPYSLTNSAGTWAKTTSNYTFATYTSTETIHYPGTANVNTFVTGASGRRVGMHFTMPSDVCTSYKIRGVHFLGDIGDVGSTVSFGIWDASNVQQVISAAIDTDTFGSASQNFQRVCFATPPTLTPGTKYYIAMQTANTNAHNVAGIQLADADDRKAYPMGANRGAATYDGSTWTDTNTVLPMIDLILDDITAPAGGGGGAVVIGGVSQTGIGAF